MHTISRRRLGEFWEQDAESKVSLNNWYRTLTKLAPQTYVELRQTFPQADLVGKCTVFNVAGNKYRVITRIHFDKQVVLVRFVLAHSEYDKDKWKTDCC